jgi:hypothetical protein
MSFTSEEGGNNDYDALMNLINDKAPQKKETGKKAKKRGTVEVKFNEDGSDLKLFNTQSKRLIGD